MKSLKILHSESSRGWGGQEVRTLKEMIALRDSGTVIELVCPPMRGSARAARVGFAVHHARMRGGGDVRSMMSIKALLRRKAFDVLNTHSGHDSLVAGMAGAARGYAALVRTRHLALPISSLATYTWIPHRVIAVSRYVRQYLISAGVAAGRVQTIYDGIPKPEPIAQSTLRAELGLGPDALIGCMVAIMRDKKGHEDLIEAAEPLLATRPNLHFVMAGERRHVRADQGDRRAPRARPAHPSARLSHRHPERAARLRPVRAAHASGSARPVVHRGDGGGAAGDRHAASTACRN